MTELGIITTHAELLAALDALPPPAAGDVRVFRGQNRDFGAMTPAALRTAASADKICSVYPATLAGADLGRTRRRPRCVSVAGVYDKAAQWPTRGVLARHPFARDCRVVPAASDRIG